MTTVADLLNHICNVLGVGESAPERIALLSHAEVSKVTIDPRLAPRIAAQLISKDAAKKDEELGKYFRAMAFNQIDTELESTLTASGKLPKNWAEIKSTTPKTLDRIVKIMTTDSGTQMTPAQKREKLRLQQDAKRIQKKNGTKDAPPTVGANDDVAKQALANANYYKRIAASRLKELEATNARLAALEGAAMESQLHSLVPADRLNLGAGLSEVARKQAIKAALDDFAAKNNAKIAIHEGAPKLIGADGKPVELKGADGKPLPEGSFVTEALKANGLLREQVKSDYKAPASGSGPKVVETPTTGPVTPQERARQQALEQTIKL